LVEVSLEGELDAHLSKSRGANRCNGKQSKKVKTGFGMVDITTPRAPLNVKKEVCFNVY